MQDLDEKREYLLSTAGRLTEISSLLRSRVTKLTSVIRREQNRSRRTECG
jgi:hypothetical protein